MTLIARGIVFALACAPGLAYAAKASDEKMTDARLVALLHHVNQDEIAAGKLAQRGQSVDIKAYGKQLVTDHSSSDQEVMAAAKKAGISPTDSALTASDKEMMRVDKNKMGQIKRMSGAEFDRTFAQVLVQDHQHMISLLRDHKGDLQSPELKTLVDNTIPVLEKHKDLARKALRNAPPPANLGRTPNPPTRR